MLLSEAIERFVADNRHRWAPTTASWYARMATPLIFFMGDVNVETITPQDLRDWMYWQVAEKEYSDNTRVGMYLSVSKMFEYLARVGIATDHFNEPGSNLKRPKIREQVQEKAKHRVIFSFLEFIEHEIAGYLGRRAYESSAIGTRDLAMIWLLLSTGCRRVEISRLQMRDFEIQKTDGKRLGVIRFIGKGLKQRRNYISKEPLEAMENWLAVRPEANSDDHDGLFLAMRPINGVYRPLREKAVNARIQYWAKKGGFQNETLNPHAFRRAFATYAVSNGVPITVVQKQLGHSDVKTTMHYIKHDEEALLNQSKRILDVLANDWKSRE